MIYAAQGYAQHYGGKVQDDPGGAQKRAWMIDVFHKAIDKLDKEGVHLDPAAAQATWWTPEQHLYKHLGARDVGGNYADALKKLFAKE